MSNQFRAGLGSLVGQTDGTYQFAKLAIPLSVIGMVGGIIWAVYSYSRDD